MNVEKQVAICVECLNCRHRGVLDAPRLQHYGVLPDVSLADLTRRLVCDACGSRAMRAFRSSAEQAEAFLRT